MEKHTAEHIYHDGHEVDRSKAALAHGLGFLGFIIPFGNIIGPLILYIYRKPNEKMLEKACRESINFQINILIYLAVCIVLCFLFIGFILIPLLAIFNIVVMIIAIVDTLNGKDYEYPCMLFRLLK